ncbi:MAG: GFA family protein [Litoreibacter sp.]
MVACHCNQCRKTSGHHVAATSALWTQIEITGHPTWYASSQIGRRGFCGTCGSNLFWHDDGAHVSIFAGTLDGATGLSLRGHIFCADKGDYYEITDTLPRADGDDLDLAAHVS